MVSNNTLLYISLGGIGLIAILAYSAINEESKIDRLAQNADNVQTSPGVNLSPPTEPSQDTAVIELQEKIAQLQEQITAESQKRAALQLKLAKLEGKISKQSPESTDNNSDSNENDADSDNPHQAFSTGNDPEKWFNEQALVEVGIDSAKINYIKSIFEQTEMEKLYLRDQATREGWMNSKRYRDEAKSIADKSTALKNELTDEEYDAYLYASGRSNRVVVTSVLGSSPAENAGIKSGDIILKYGDDRVYNWTDLTTATSEGDTVNTVAVTIIRDGQQQQVYIPRGPLGVRLSTDSVAP